MEAYRTIVRNAVQSLVDELGAAGRPAGRDGRHLPPRPDRRAPTVTGRPPTPIGGQLGALRDRFGLTDDNVNTIEEEGVRTAFWTLVDMVVDLRASWTAQRSRFAGGAGDGLPRHRADPPLAG